MEEDDKSWFPSLGHVAQNIRHMAWWSRDALSFEELYYENISLLKKHYKIKGPSYLSEQLSIFYSAKEAMERRNGHPNCQKNVVVLDAFIEFIDELSQNHKSQTNPSLSFQDLLPSNISRQGIDYILNYPFKTEKSLAALVVAIGLQKTKPFIKLIKALEEHFELKIKRQNFSDFHIYQYALAISREKKDSARYKEIQILKKAIYHE